MSPPGISVDRGEPGVAIVALSGEVETFLSPRLERELTALLAEGSDVVVDLSAAEFLDSSVMTVLLRAREDARNRNARFALVMDDTTGWAVRRLFEVTGLDGIFTIAQSRTEALSAAS